MSTAARRRLMRDFRRLQEDPPMGVSGAPGENNIMIWNAVIFGTQNTYETKYICCILEVSLKLDFDQFQNIIYFPIQVHMTLHLKMVLSN